MRVAKVGIIVGRGRGSIAKPLRKVGEGKLEKSDIVENVIRPRPFALALKFG